jgi:hypothetical protein
LPQKIAQKTQKIRKNAQKVGKTRGTSEQNAKKEKKIPPLSAKI